MEFDYRFQQAYIIGITKRRTGLENGMEKLNGKWKSYIKPI